MRAAARTCGVALGALLLASSVLHAQARRAVSGVIRDSASGVPLAGALVDLRSASYQTAARSNQRGEFRMGDVPGGDYLVVVRRIGYVEMQRDVRTMDRDTSLVLSMVPVRRELDTMRVVARLNGIRGVVGTAQGLQPIADATVQVVGLGRPVRTDSAGRFFVELKKGGTFMVRFARAGYSHQLVSIDVPMEGTVETSALLDSADGREWSGTNTLWDDFDKRIIWRGSKSALVSAAELEKLDGMSLSSALNASKSGFRRGLRVGPNTCVFVNGMPRPGFQVDGFDPENVEAVELYGPGGEGTGMLRLQWPARSPCGGSQGGGPYGATPGSMSNVAYAVIWLKKR